MLFIFIRVEVYFVNIRISVRIKDHEDVCYFLANERVFNIKISIKSSDLVKKNKYHNFM